MLITMTSMLTHFICPSVFRLTFCYSVQDSWPVLFGVEHTPQLNEDHMISTARKWSELSTKACSIELVALILDESDSGQMADLLVNLQIILMEVDLTNLNLQVWENAPRSVYNWNGTKLEALLNWIYITGNIGVTYWWRLYFDILTKYLRLKLWYSRQENTFRRAFCDTLTSIYWNTCVLLLLPWHYRFRWDHKFEKWPTCGEFEDGLRKCVSC